MDLASPSSAVRRRPAAPVAAASALDRVHDHVARLVGDRDLAARVTRDVATRAAARADDLGQRPTITRLLRLAHARLGAEGSRRSTDASATFRQAALVDCVVRQGLTPAAAARVLGIEAADARRELPAARRALAASVGTPVASLDEHLRSLPVLPAPADGVAAVDAPRRRDLRPTLAWVATAMVTVVALGSAVLVPSRLAVADPSEVPVVRGVPVTDDLPVASTPTDGDTDPSTELVLTPSTDIADDQAPGAAATPTPDEAGAASDEPADATTAPAPTPTPTPAPDSGTDDTPEGDAPAPAPLPLPLPAGP